MGAVNPSFKAFAGIAGNRRGEAAEAVLTTLPHRPTTLVNAQIDDSIRTATQAYATS